EQLTAEGYLEGKVGAGTNVNTLLPDDLLNAQIRPVLNAGRSSERSAKVRLSDYGLRLNPVPQLPVLPVRAFRPLQPAVDEFPMSLWAQIASRRMRRASLSLLADSDSRGYRPLREAISHYLGASRGVKCDPDQVVVVSGIQHGLDLTARLTINPGDSVLVEDPCHPVVVAMLRAAGAQIIPVEVDVHGVDVGGLNFESGESLSRLPTLIYTTPSHQFPLGVTMSIDRRLELLGVAGRIGALIFEDDYDSEYRYAGRPIPALQGLDAAGSSVVFAGSFSKVLLPSLRLGYLVVPPEVVDKFAAARFISDRHSSIIDQAAMCDFIG